MEVIKTLISHIEEEVNDAETYAKLAAKYKEADKELSTTFAALSEQELSHADMLHKQAVRLIAAHGKEVPSSMQAIWDWEHEKIVDHTARVRVMLSLAR